MRSWPADDKSRRATICRRCSRLSQRIEHDRPTCFIAYTIKGFGLPLRRPQGQSRRPDDSRADGGASRDACDDPAGPRMGAVRGPRRSRPSAAGFPRRGRRSRPTGSAASGAAASPCLPNCRSPTQTVTVDAGGLRHDPRTRSRAAQTPLAERIVTTSPDVTVSTNLGAWVNRRGLFAREALADTFKKRTHRLDVHLGVLAEGPAYRARHRREQSLHPALGARPVAFASTASGCCRSARSTIPSSRAASMR